MKQTKFTKSARGEHCDARLPGICNGNPETVVLAHLPDGSGTGKMGGKSNDLCSVYACSACHDEIDGRTRFMRDTCLGDGVLTGAEVDSMLMIYAYEGHMRTLRKFQQKGLI